MNEMNSKKTEQQSLWSMIKCGSGTAQDRRNQYRFTAWMLAWAISLVAATWALKSEFDFSHPLDWFIAIVPTTFGIAGLFAYLRFLREADEMIRRIQLEGLAIGFGVGVLFIMGYLLLERVGAPAINSHDTVAIMMLAWVFGQLMAMRRYR